MATKSAQLGFDPKALQEKYAAERDKRLRSDGVAQYIEVEGIFKRYKDDPYITQPSTRGPLTEEIGVIIIGGGYGGLQTAVRMLQAGVSINDIRIIEKAGGWGGTWYWNRYPGAACDVESYIYIPLLEETGIMPTEKYAKGPELLNHANKIAEQFNLTPRALFQTEVSEMDWEEDSKRWIVRTDRKDIIKARFIITASGVLHKPKLPGLKNIQHFKGVSFHSSRWDYDYTGGNTHNPDLHKLKNKRVGVIGTGATAVQIVPHLGNYAKELYVFQRTPSAVGVRNNKPTDPNWWKTLKPGWQVERRENFQTIISGGQVEVDLIDDGWTEILKYLSFPGSAQANTASAQAERAAVADMQMMESIRARIDNIVKDKKTADSLKPWYNTMCKRPCFHDEYLQTFNRPNVTLVDTDGKGVEGATERGLIANGQEYELDCIVYATGFETSTDFGRRNGITITGREETLDQKWSRGVSTLHGIHSRGFPNCFIISPSQAAATTNFVHSIDEQAKQIAYVVSTCQKKKIICIEPSEAAETAWVDGIKIAAPFIVEAVKHCTPGYFNAEGKADLKTYQQAPFPGGMPGYLAVLAEWNNGDTLPGMEIVTELSESEKRRYKTGVQPEQPLIKSNL